VPRLALASLSPASRPGGRSSAGESEAIPPALAGRERRRPATLSRPPLAHARAVAALSHPRYRPRCHQPYLLHTPPPRIFFIFLMLSSSPRQLPQLSHAAPPCFSPSSSLLAARARAHCALLAAPQFFLPARLAGAPCSPLYSSSSVHGRRFSLFAPARDVPLPGERPGLLPQAPSPRRAPSLWSAAPPAMAAKFFPQPWNFLCALYSPSHAAAPSSSASARCPVCRPCS
jgi:hypothetical protein